MTRKVAIISGFSFSNPFFVTKNQCPNRKILPIPSINTSAIFKSHIFLFYRLCSTSLKEAAMFDVLDLAQ